MNPPPAPVKPTRKRAAAPPLATPVRKRLFGRVERTPFGLPDLIFDVTVDVEDDGRFADTSGFDCKECKGGFQFHDMTREDVSILLDNIFDYNTFVRCTPSSTANRHVNLRTS